MSKTSPHQNTLWVDLTRALVMFGVVLTHVSADVITEWGIAPKSWWLAANVYDSFTRGCVPLFIMLSGALLLPKQESYLAFFKKRLGRIAIPFVVWTLLYLLWKKGGETPRLSPSEAFREVAEGHIYYHLWFFYILPGLYLLTPIFRILVAKARTQDLIYFLLLCFWAASLAPFISQLHYVFTGKTFSIALSLEPATGFIGYFVLGYFLRKHATEKWRTPAEGILLLSLFGCMAGTYYLSSHTHTFQNLLYGNMAPNVVLYTASVFILLRTLPVTLETRCPLFLRKGIQEGARVSFGIYLIHPMILETLASGKLGFVLKPLANHPVYLIPLIAILVYGLSWILIALIQRIPYLRRIV